MDREAAAEEFARNLMALEREAGQTPDEEKIRHFAQAFFRLLEDERNRPAT